MRKLKALWGQLPHQLQAALIAAGTITGTTFAQSFFGADCYSVACLKHYVWGSLLAGGAVLRAFYMKPNRPDPAPTQAGG